MQPTLIDFYTCVSPVTLTTGEQYYIDEFVSKDDAFWEKCHNFIQWVFPNSVPSNFNPDAPLLKDTDIEYIASGPWKKLYGRFLIFLGIYWENEDFQNLFVFNEDRFSRWFNGVDHNCLRVTRVLTFLQSVKAYDQLDALWTFLYTQNMRRDEIVGDVDYEHTTLWFWFNAYDYQSS